MPPTRARPASISGARARHLRPHACRPRACGFHRTPRSRIARHLAPRPECADHPAFGAHMGFPHAHHNRLPWTANHVSPARAHRRQPSLSTYSVSAAPDTGGQSDAQQRQSPRRQRYFSGIGLRRRCVVDSQTGAHRWRRRLATGKSLCVLDRDFVADHDPAKVAGRRIHPCLDISHQRGSA